MALDVYQIVDKQVGSIKRKETERVTGAGKLKLTLISATTGSRCEITHIDRK